MDKKKARTSNINPSFLKGEKNKLSNTLTLEQYTEGISNNDRIILSKAITLVESKNQEDRILASGILNSCLQLGTPSIRIGISGSPGVGKSTFIEALGLHLLSMGKKPAVLAIDPASTISKGSVLGDKTRMSKLSKEKNAYIRPSSAAGHLGGIQRNTKESIVLCEAAGYDVILIETVGVGQAETKVHSMVDFFMLLILPGSGDELQGIKRGIVELADLILINKSDGDRSELAKKTRQSYSNAMHLLARKENNWITKVLNISSLLNSGIIDSWNVVEEFSKQFSQDYFENLRHQQDKSWFEEQSKQLVFESLFDNEKINQKYHATLMKLEKEQLNVFQAFDIFREFLRNSI